MNQLLDMINAMWLPRAVQTAAELGLADLVADGPRPAADLAAATGTHEPSLYRLLRALASVDVFAEVEPGVFAQTPSSAWLAESHPASVRDAARMYGAEWHWRSWAALPHAVRTGEAAFDQVYGMTLWRYLAEVDPAAGRVFDAAMTGLSNQINEPLARAYDFSAIGTVMDVGGGHGSLLANLLARYPTLHGVLFDRPSVVSGAPETLQAAGVAERCRVVAGDFLTDAIPSGADAYVLKTVLHDWNDDDADRILRNCRKAVSGDGLVLVVEQVLPTPPAKISWLNASLDLEMLQGHGGRERTEPEFAALLASAGFALTRVVPTGSPFVVLEARAT